MTNLTEDRLQSILELEPGDNAPYFYRQGFADAQRKIHGKLSGEARAEGSSTLLESARALGAELVELNAVIAELAVAYGNAGAKSDAFESKLFGELVARRETIRTQLRELG